MGAALGTVGGTCDLLVNLGPIKEVLKEEGGAGGTGMGAEESEKLEHRARLVALERGREFAREVILKKGQQRAMTQAVYV